ncbi:unnamed protein product [Gulo gulo]|uniref:Uncharacterized protein n=1 Tax=Gulo gulo TaxID=48420 RepID=A0A9X9LS04_GULGU|nr:unnamed protein product [Gulo gulo]
MSDLRGETLDSLISFILGTTRSCGSSRTQGSLFLIPVLHLKWIWREGAGG